MFGHDRRPSPKGKLPLADWLVPVHYLRRDSLHRARVARPAGAPSLDDLSTTFPAARGMEGGLGSLDPLGVFVVRDDLFYQLEAGPRLGKIVVLHGLGGTGRPSWQRHSAGDGVTPAGWTGQSWSVALVRAGVASFGLDVVTKVGFAVWGSHFARLEPSQSAR